LQAAALLQQLLRGLLVRPEIGRGSLRLDLFQLRALSRDIKETSRVVGRVYLNRRKSFLNPDN
jgi:hypothetical protein